MKYFSTIHFVLLVLWILLTAGGQNGKAKEPDNVLIQILKSNPELFESILENAEKYKLQILYTQIDRDKDNAPHFTSYSYRLNKTDYFYPASTVKLPAAILALEKINNLHISGLNKYTSLKIDSAFSHQTAMTTDSTAENNLPSIAHFIKKIFLVSDNDAYNRLYEFLGQQYLNETLWQKGFGDVKIIRRLESGMTPEENRVTNPFTFYNNDSIIYQQPLTKNETIYKVEMSDVRQGIGYMKGDSLINQPIDFSFSNYISVESLQGILKAVIFPEAQKFNLSDDDYQFLYKYMSMLPGESVYPAYQDTSFYDSYVKFFMFGDSREKIPDHIRIFSKSGQAYGYLIDNAYIVDFREKIEFLLTAVIQVNENRIYNDDNYEYDEIGVPFLANLGKAIYQFEISRERKFKPDLSKFAFGAEYPQLIENSQQMLLVVTANDSAQTGTLYLFQREKESDNWQMTADKIPVVVGRKGLAWGSEEDSDAMPNIPQKVEGDGKSPAGVFTLGACFGFAKKTEMKDLKIPYLHITELTECIDDRNSQYYNKIVQRDGVEEVDWNSSEKMRHIDPEYKIGVVVNYNTESTKSGGGSCIFLHIWGAPTKPTSGCTAMSEKDMREIANWLDIEKNPILVQLTKPLYDSLKNPWNLPEVSY